MQGSSVVTPTGTFPLQDYITGMSDRELLETDSFGDYPISILVSKVRCLFVFGWNRNVWIFLFYSVS